MSGAQVAAGGGGSISQALGEFGDGDVPVAILRIQLRDAHKTRQRFVSLAAQFKSKSGGHELFDRFLGAVLLLEQQRVPRDALGRLLVRLQEMRVQGQRFRFFARGRESVEQHSVVDGGPVRPVLQR